MRTKLLLTVTFSFIVFNSFSQKRTCHSNTYWEQQKIKHPQAEQIKKNLETNTEKWISAQPIDRFIKSNRQGERAVITIPVVVHVVHDGDALNTGSNISVAQINSQITALNRDYRLLNTDSLAIAHPFWANTADCSIEFCLAKRDEQGNATTGITRTQAGQTSFSYAEADKIKQNSTGGKDGWDPFNYLNVWVYVSDPGEGLLGFATGPATLSFDPDMDGVAIDYKYFGTMGSATFPFNLGRTTTHEVGHWLNLEHIWGNNFCGNDGVSDTPEAEEENYFCPSFPHNANNACGTGGTGINGEMFMNYMDYTDDDCMVMFTNGQSARMNAVLNGSRQALLSSAGCIPVSGVSVNELFNEMVSIAPNPSTGIFHIGLANETGTASLKISVADITGKIHIVKQIRTENGNYAFDASQLPNGIYFVKIEEGERVVTRKVTLIGK
jgi:hypothetical protein